ncbi:hypothetical protein [Catenulispora rubra]|uniref:hypothetical protein n=1 Tax=Catenulispora rubra TaxID=280293 RepID=UPI0018923615|nr:hypothetical protein [Catenulispora rubra]
MNRRNWAVLAVAAAAVIGGVAWMMAGRGGVGRQVSATDGPWPPKPGRSAGGFTAQQAVTLSGDLAAGTDAGVRAAVALPAGQSLDPGTLRQIKALGPVAFDSSTFHDDQDGTATVVARLGGQAGQPAAGSGGGSKWTVHLIDADGQWKISLTEPAR